MQQLVVLLLLLLDLPVMGTELFSNSIMNNDSSIHYMILLSCVRLILQPDFTNLFVFSKCGREQQASVRFSAFKYVHLVFNVENRKGKPKEPKLKVVVH